MNFAKLATLACIGTALACSGPPFRAQTASGFIALEHQEDEGYGYRATTPEGVVYSVRAQDETRGDTDFWVRTLTLRVRDEMGYALLETADVVSADGSKGKTLKFGHDEGGKPYVYWITVFQAQGRLFLAEAGASKDLFEKAKPRIEWMTKALKVKCDVAVAPILASRTCNRW
jgi:hypothetical protein